MRILFISSSSGSQGGGEIFLLYLASALRAQGHTVGLWLAQHPRMNALAEAFAAHGDVLRSDYRNLYDYWHRGLWPVPKSPHTLARWRREWSEWRPHIVHFNKQCLEDGLDLIQASAALTIPHLTTIHITQTARFLKARLGWLRDFRARRVLCHYRGPIVAVAKARAAELRRFLGPPPPRVQSILNGVPPAVPCPDRIALRYREELFPGLPAIVAVGRLEPQKRPERFLHEIIRIREAGLNIQGRWIGGGRDQDKWDRIVHQSNLRSVIRQDSWRSDVANVLPAFDVFLHTAAYEGLPLALLEAMQAGLPCVVADEVATQLPPELQSTVIPLGDSLDWRALLSDKAKLARIAQAGQRVVAEHYSTAVMAQAYTALYTQLCRH